MKKNITYTVLCLLLLCSCKKTEAPQEDQLSDIPMEFETTIEGTRAIGATGYQATAFANTDQISIFATRTRKDGQPAETANIYAQFMNILYS